MLPSELTNTIKQFIVYVHRNEPHFTYIYVYHTNVLKLKTTEWKVQANETRCLLDREPCRLFILRGPKCLTPCVDLSSHQYPKKWLLTDFVWGFHPKITIWRKQRNPFIYVRNPEGPRIKHCLVVRWDSMSSKRPMHVILCEAFLLKGTPKGVENRLLFM